MKKWDDLLNTPPSKKHRQSVFNAAREELKANRERADVPSFFGAFSKWLPWGAALAGALSVAIYFNTVDNVKHKDLDTITALVSEDYEIIEEDLELMEDLEVVEMLDELEQEINI